MTRTSHGPAQIERLQGPRHEVFWGGHTGPQGPLVSLVREADLLELERKAARLDRMLEAAK